MATHAHSTTAPSRRSLLVVATAATLLPAAMAAPSASGHAAAWRDVIASYGRIHPNAMTTIARAMDEDLDPTMISEIFLSGPVDAQLPVFVFGKRTDFEYITCGPHECGEYRRLG